LICVQVAFGQQGTPPKDALKVSIDPSKRQFHEGDPLQFSITITNVGDQWYLIPNRISLMHSPSSIDAVGVLEVDLRTQTGQYVAGPSVGFAADCGEIRRIKLRLEDVFMDYIFLRPGASYVQQFGLGDVYPTVRPGKYFFAAEYHAYFSPKACREWTTEDIDKFPFKPWYGSAPANKVSFEVLPSPKKTN